MLPSRTSQHLLITTSRSPDSPRRRHGSQIWPPPSLDPSLDIPVSHHLLLIPIITCCRKVQHSALLCGDTYSP